MKHTSSLIVILALLMTSLPSVVRVGGTPVAAQETGPTLGWDVQCDYVASEPIDPIVKKDLSDSDHLHDLFGAHVTRTSNYQTLRAANTDHCDYLDDEAGYWTPSLYDRTDTQVFPRHVHAYYRVAVGVDPALIQPWPQGLEVVAGSHMATGAQFIDGPPRRRKVQWFCGGGGEGRTATRDQPYDCTEPGFPYVTVSTIFPDCAIDGVPRNDQDHQTHMTYSASGICPPSHPRHVPQLWLQISYGTSLGTGAYLASSLQHGRRDAYGMHADFMDGWSQERVASLIVQCMRGPTGCGPVRRSTTNGPVLSPRITGAGTVREVTPAARVTCTTPATTPGGVPGPACPTARYGLGSEVALEAIPAPGYAFAGWQAAAGAKPSRCDGADASHFLLAGPCRFQIWESGAIEARFVETSSPETTIAGGPASLTQSASATFTFTADEPGARFECALDGGPYAACASGQTFADLADGPHTFDVRAISLAGNADASPARHAWRVDAAVPSGGILIDAGAPATTNRNVTLAITAADPEPGSGVTQMRFRNALAAWTAWAPLAATKAWTLTAGAGPKTVEAEFRDAAGNVSTLVGDDIDFEAPAVGGSIVVNDGAEATRLVDVTLALDASANTTEMRLRNVPQGWTAWEPVAATRTWTLTTGDGPKVVEAEFRDGNGTVSPPASDEIRLDTIPPSGTVAVDAGAATTRSRDVTLTLDAVAATAQVRVRNVPGEWTEWEPLARGKAWTLLPGDGVKTVAVQFADEAGNPSDQTSDDIRLDGTGPVGSVDINGGDPVTRTREVALSLDAAPGTSEVRLRNDTAGAWSNWRTYGPRTNWTLAPGDGAKRLFVQFRDAAGNLSDVHSDAIRLDTVAPHGAVAIDGGAGVTTVREVRLTLTASDGTEAVRLRNDGAAAWTPWTPFASTTAWTLPAGNGTKRVEAQFRDAAGNVSAEASDTIRLDAAGPSGSVVIDGDAAATGSARVTLTLDATSGTTAMRLRNGSGAWSNWRSYARQTAWTLTAGDGEKSVAAEFKDAAGNVSRAVSDAIRLDTAAPSGTILINNGAPGTTSRAVTLKLTATDPAPGSGPIQMRFRNGATGAWSGWRPFAATASWTLPEGGGGKQVFVEFRDAAGNVSREASDSITLVNR